MSPPPRIIKAIAATTRPIIRIGQNIGQNIAHGIELSNHVDELFHHCMYPDHDHIVGLRPPPTAQDTTARVSPRQTIIAG